MISAWMQILEISTGLESIFNGLRNWHESEINHNLKSFNKYIGMAVQISYGKPVSRNWLKRKDFLTKLM